MTYCHHSKALTELHVPQRVFHPHSQNEKRFNKILIKYALFCLFSFCGEGPRSRSYGRTTALRLIVQIYDEDEEKDD
jgi:hypothetical protein